MTKNNEQKIRNDLKDLLENDELEYVLYGQLAPQTKRIIIIFALWCIPVVLILFNILPIGLYLLGLAFLLLIISYLFFYQLVYLGKFGKYFYIYEFDRLHISSHKDKVLIKSTEIVDDRTSELHLTLQLIFNEQVQFIIFKRDSTNKGYPNQSTNIKKLKLDINKKHKK